MKKKTEVRSVSANLKGGPTDSRGGGKSNPMSKDIGSGPNVIKAKPGTLQSARSERNLGGDGSKGGSPTKSKKDRGDKGKETAKPNAVKVFKPQDSFVKRLFNSIGLFEDEVILRDPKAIEAQNALGLKQWHLKKLRRQYNKIDMDGSGSIDRHEFLEAVNEDSSAFTDKLFDLIDQDGSGSIEFEEYVITMATYCVFTKDEIMTFVFDCFDADSSGAIDEKEFMTMIKAVNNAAPSFPKNFTNALELFDTNGDGQIDYQEFLEIERRFPILLFPAFRLQDTMQKGSLGEKAWVKIMQDYNNARIREEYKQNHGGKPPPDKPLDKLLKLFCPCLFDREKSYVQAGSALAVKGKRS